MIGFTHNACWSVLCLALTGLGCDAAHSSGPANGRMDSAPSTALAFGAGAPADRPPRPVTLPPSPVVSTGSSATGTAGADEIAPVEQAAYAGQAAGGQAAEGQPAPVIAASSEPGRGSAVGLGQDAPSPPNAPTADAGAPSSLDGGVPVESERGSPPPAGPRDPGRGPWQAVPVEQVRDICKLDPEALRAADRKLDRPWAAVRYGRLCHAYQVEMPSTEVSSVMCSGWWRRAPTYRRASAPWSTTFSGLCSSTRSVSC